LRLRFQPGLSSCTLLVLCALWASSCAAPLGPGYVVEKQEIRVQFTQAAQSIHIDAEYHLRNTGDRPICELEILLPAERRLHISPAVTQWDGADIATELLPGRSRNSVVRLASPWPVDVAHALHIAYDILPSTADAASLSFVSDAFYLPAEGWSPELPQIRGLFGFGGVPPKRWELTIDVPAGFLVHSSGTLKKTSRDGKNNMQSFRASQTVADRYPFVVAGRYSAKEIRDPHQKIILWSRASRDSGVLQQASKELARTIDVYNSIFGAPASRVTAFWIVECPLPDGCVSHLRSAATLLDEDATNRPSAELASSDSVMVDVSKGAPKLAAAAAPSLAASWLGYGRNPGFFEQAEPLSVLPIFAAARSREEIEGPQVRGETVRHALRLFSANPRTAPLPAATASARGANAAAATSNDGNGAAEARQLLRAKSLLFFYGLQDRYGAKVFHDAIGHMLYARASRGFELDDLIAAFEQETHQNVAEFVRLWMKHPGIPADFRARYENSTAAAVTGRKESSVSSAALQGATP
jgi:hypothetical protein